MYQPKVTNTQKYEDSQGSHIVTPAKLIFADKNIAIKDIPEFFEEDILENVRSLKPILISETEEIEEGDRYLLHNIVCKYVSGNKDIKKDAKKILALPEHFSDKHLQAISDGKMKDGDEVLVKCVKSMDTEKNLHSCIFINIHLDQQNHITLFPVKQSIELDGLQSLKLAIIANAEDVDKAEKICKFLTDYVYDLKTKNSLSAKQSLEEAAGEYSSKAHENKQNQLWAKEDFKAGAEWAAKTNYKGE